MLFSCSTWFDIVGCIYSFIFDVLLASYLWLLDLGGGVEFIFYNNCNGMEVL